MNRKVLAGWFLIGIGLTTTMLGWMIGNRALAALPAAETYDSSTGSYEDLLRIHVIANSDSDEDQALKLKVRDAVLAELAPRLTGVATVAEAEAVVRSALPFLEQVAAEVIGANGMTYGVRAEVGRFSFPGKSYGDLYLPAGEYKALRVVLGEGKGANFWCLVFPTLCYNIREFKRPTYEYSDSFLSAGRGGTAPSRW